MKISLLGFGTVGRGAYDILIDKKASLNKNLNKEVELGYIFKRSKPDGEFEGIYTDKFDDIINSDTDIVVEMTGDVESSYKYITESLKNKKNVVSSNKAVVSKYFEEFLELAKKNDVKFLYESAVAGTVPIVREIKSLSLINDINKIYGIINGTSNFILYNMFKNNLSYEDVLNKAKELGYAEADPTDDVCGYDAMRKLRILSSIAFAASIKNEDIFTEGISKIKPCDVAFLKSKNCVIKHLAYAEKFKEGYIAIVEPAVVKDDSYLGTVEDAQNALSIFAPNFEIINLGGPGAGKLPTGSAVVQDIVDIVLDNDIPIRPFNNLNNLGDSFKANYYLRLKIETEFYADYIDEIFEDDDYKYIFTTEISRSKLVKFVEEQSGGDYFFARL